MEKDTWVDEIFEIKKFEIENNGVIHVFGWDDLAPYFEFCETDTIVGYGDVYSYPSLKFSDDNIFEFELHTWMTFDDITYELEERKDDLIPHLLLEGLI